MRIGILEDYQSLGRILQLSLGFAGYTVHTYENIIDFLSFMGSPAPADLVIVDFRLLAERREIRLSGADVIRHLRTLIPNLPAILISAAPLSAMAAATADLPRVKLLQKPFKTATLLEMIKTMVATDVRTDMIL